MIESKQKGNGTYDQSIYMSSDAWYQAKLSANKEKYLDGLNLHSIQYKKIKDIILQYGVYYVQSIKKKSQVSIPTCTFSFAQQAYSFLKKLFNFVSPYGSAAKDPPAKQETQV